MDPSVQSQVTVTPIDFTQTALAGSYDDGWQPAGLSTGDAQQTAQWIYEKLRPYVEEIHEVTPEGRWGCIAGKAGKKQGPTWSLAGVNPRLSFLRYGPGHYFKPHCDGLNEVGATKSFVTLHLYLNDSALASEPLHLSTASPPPGASAAVSASEDPSPSFTPFPAAPSSSTIAPPQPESALNPEPPAASDVLLHGGSTRFWTPAKKAYLDVHPKLGRVLVFQQRMLVHSGEEVTQGIKYTVRSNFMFLQKEMGNGKGNP